MNLDKIRYRTVIKPEPAEIEVRVSKPHLDSFDKDGKLMDTTRKKKENASPIESDPPSVPDYLRMYIEGRYDYFALTRLIKSFLPLASLEYRSNNTWLPIHSKDEDGCNSPDSCESNIEHLALRAIGSTSLKTETEHADLLRVRPIDYVCWFAGEITTYCDEPWVRPLVKAFRTEREHRDSHVDPNTSYQQVSGCNEATFCLTVTQAAKRLSILLYGENTVEACKSRISKMCDTEEIQSKGNGRNRRIKEQSFMNFCIKEKERINKEIDRKLIQDRNK